MKMQVLELAYNYGAYIIEEDTCGDFFYGEKPVPLKAMDTRERVIYLKSFDRILTSGLAGYIVCPHEISNRLQCCGTSGYIQRSLDYYFKNYNFDAHCTKIRGIYARRFQRTIIAAETFLSQYASFVKPTGGLGLWICPHDNFSVNEFIKHKVLVSPGNLYSNGTGAERHFRINFANTREDDIYRGIGIIASVLQLHRG
jgi:DNA-binding transcriptional MocR family regulator